MTERKIQQSSIILMIGLSVLVITLLLKQFIGLPDFVSGLGIGLALGLELISLYVLKKIREVVN